MVGGVEGGCWCVDAPSGSEGDLGMRRAGLEARGLCTGEGEREGLGTEMEGAEAHSRGPPM